jgi:hypothetical protein
MRLRRPARLTISPGQTAGVFLVEHVTNFMHESAADPDPNVFGPPGFRSISQRYGFGIGSLPFLIKALRGLK